MWKRGEIAPISPFFPQYFQYISIFRSQITYLFVKCGCLNIFFLKSANLICRDTDISKYFRESLGLRDNESRLYIVMPHCPEVEPQRKWICTPDRRCSLDS